jgi:DNA (cytosine-5)-methyltransferase 1
MGYHRAGFDVVGVDIEPQPHYPFEFHQDDALDYLRWWWGDGTGDFAAIHASPVCWKWSELSKAHPGRSEESPDYISPTRELLRATGLPWVMENVETAPLAGADDLMGNYGMTLCGTMFGHRIYRHRKFETSFPLVQPQCAHSKRAWNPHNVAGRQAMNDEGLRGDLERPWREDMEVAWMGRYEAREAIPPYFTEFIGHQLLRHLAKSEVKS